jgi:putative FmdB family regulatory protein
LAATIDAMPIYEFRCEACGAVFEELVEAGTEATTCAACGSERTRRMLSAQAAPFSLLKTPGGSRKQERRNARLRASTEARFKEARRRARARGRSGSGDGS